MNACGPMHRISRWTAAGLAAGWVTFAGAADGGAPAAADRAYGWRGDGSGVFPDATPPLAWSDTSNVAWKVAVGGGYSSPVVVGARVLVASEPDQVVCLNVAEGKLLWSKTTTAADLPEAERANVGDFYHDGTSGNAAATPASDGTRAFMVFGNGLVTALDLKSGARVWLRHIATQPKSMEGRSASPILAGGALLVHLTALFALAPATGQIVWTQPTASDAYGTPVATRLGDVDVVVTPCGDLVRVADGKVLCSDIGMTKFSSPIVQRDIACFGDDTCVAAQLPAVHTGRVASAKELWTDNAPGQIYSSPVLWHDRLYAVTGDGKLTVFDTKTRTHTEQTLDLAAGGGEATVYASVTLAGKHLFVSDNQGVTAVLKADGEATLVGLNRLSEGAGGTPAFAGSRIFVRAGESLYCLK